MQSMFQEWTEAKPHQLCQQLLPSGNTVESSGPSPAAQPMTYQQTEQYT